MKKFVIKSLPFILIILVYGLVGEYFLLRNKEVISIKTVTETQAKATTELYYGRQILGNSLSNYKFQRFMQAQPKVLVLGQSVVLQFRNFMFSPYQADFYNTGLMARNAKDLNYVLDLIESGQVKKPSLVLLGVDLSFFLKHTSLDAEEWTRNYPEDRATIAQSHLKGMQRIFRDKSLWRFPKTDVGFGRAGMQGRGYRNDGSYRHEGEISRFLRDSSYEDGVLLSKLQQKIEPFILPFEFSKEKESIYFKVLERFKRNGIELILYIPPYSDTFFNEAMKDPVFSGFWGHFMDVQAKLIQAGYHVIPFTTPSRMGLNDTYMVDAEHPSEVFCALQLKKSIQENTVKGKYSQALDFRIVDQLLNKKNKLPLSFMYDAINGKQWAN